MSQPASTRAGAREWIGLAILTLPAALVAMDMSVLFMAVPWLSADLAPSATQLLWIMDIYGFFVAGLLLPMGALGDRIGRRRLLLIGAAAFGAASIIAAFSTSAEMLMVARAVLGVGGATLAPSTLAIIRATFHDEAQRRTAVSAWTAAFMAGVPLGSLIGGVLVEHFWWGSVFLINLPVMAFLLLLAPVVLPESRNPEPRGFDLAGAAQSLVAVLAVVWSLKEFATDGYSSTAMLVAVAGVAVGVWFVRRQLASPEPLLDLTLFRSPGFSAAVGVNLIMILAANGNGMLITQQLQVVLGLRPVIASLWLLPMVALMISGIVVATIAAQHTPARTIVGAGLAIAAVGFASLTQLTTDSSVLYMIGGYSVMGIGMGMTLGLAVNLVMAAAPVERAGAAAAINETATEIGGALGVATLGSLAAAIYTRDVRPSLPANLNAQETTDATETLGGAVGVAAEIPQAPAAALTQAALEAFTNGVTASMAVSAVILGVAAVLSTIAFRDVLTPTQPAPKEIS